MKKIKKLLLFSLCAFLLTGCMKFKIELDVDSSGNTKASVSSMVAQSTLNEFNMTFDDFFSNMVTPESSDIFKKGEPISEIIDGTEWVGIKTKSTKTPFKAKKSNGKLVISCPLADLGSLFPNDNGETNVDFMSNISEMKMYGVGMELIVNMPNKASSNVGVVDGNKVIIDLMNIPSGVDNIEISCDSGGNNIFLFVGLALIAALMFFLFSNKKKINRTSYTPKSNESFTNDVNHTLESEADNIVDENSISEEYNPYEEVDRFLEKESDLPNIDENHIDDIDNGEDV